MDNKKSEQERATDAALSCKRCYLNFKGGRYTHADEELENVRLYIEGLHKDNAISHKEPMEDACEVCEEGERTGKCVMDYMIQNGIVEEKDVQALEKYTGFIGEFPVGVLHYEITEKDLDE